MMVPLLFGITIISFSVMHLAPGEPIDMATDLNPKASKEMKDRLRKYYGLDKPVHIQYLDWLKKIVALDFGESFSPDGKPVLKKIKESLPKTITINVLSMLFIFLIAIPIGVMSATHQYSFIDKCTTVFVFIGFATPTFWLALLLMILFGVKLGILPISGWNSLNAADFTPFQKIADVAKHLILPVFISSFGGLAGISRYMRGNMLEVIRQDYILTARAKGLKERTVIYKHALRNALLPVITIIGFSIPALIGGSVIFETIFAIPGMGMLFYTSVMSRDYPVIMGILVIGAMLTLIGNLVADVSYALADPRIRQET
jgi:peptide/nickel transport system permease protein